MAGSKKVLFIAHNFPPHGGGGVQRSAKFVKYLREYGWEPVVLTATEDAGISTDRSLLEDVPNGVAIVRVKAFNHNRLVSWGMRHGMYEIVMALSSVLALPDPQLFWARKCRQPALEIIDSLKPNIIYTTAAPYSTHLLGLWLKERVGLPWLADFRDPWSMNFHVPYLPGYRLLNRMMEKKVLAAADKVVSVSDPIVSDFRNLLGCSPEKFVTITNGFDDDEIKPLPGPIESEAKFRVLHAGSFFRKRRPTKFVRAAQRLMESGEIPRDMVEFVFVGRNAEACVPDERPFVVKPYVSHTELMDMYATSSVLLLIIYNASFTTGTYTGKIFEYLGLNRPILAVVPPGGVAEKLVNETRSGVAVGDEVDAIAHALHKMYDDWRTGFEKWDPDFARIRNYTRRELTGRLAAEFNSIQSG